MRNRGGGGGGRTEARQLPLAGAALFDAQAAVLGRYLAVRQGEPVIGQILDAQLRGKSVADVLATLPGGTAAGGIEALDMDWRGWLAQHAPKQSQ